MKDKSNKRMSTSKMRTFRGPQLITSTNQMILRVCRMKPNMIKKLRLLSKDLLKKKSSWRIKKKTFTLDLTLRVCRSLETINASSMRASSSKELKGSTRLVSTKGCS